MKRLFIFIPMCCICASALAQHPHSRGGSPFYWAIVGGIAYGGFYIIYLLCGYLVKLVQKYGIKKHMDGNYIDDSACLSNHEIRQKIDDKNFVEDGGKMPEVHKGKDFRYCRYCGKKFDYTSVRYCKHCGKPID